MSRDELRFGLVYAGLVLVSYLAVRLVPRSEIAEPGRPVRASFCALRSASPRPC